MANKNNISSFNALDIEKYHGQLLSPKERNALEKAALEDPFLADALEGYATPGVNTQADLQKLQQQLNERINEKTKVLPIGSINSSRKYSSWLKAAVAIFAIAGAGILTYQLGFSEREENTIAQQTETTALETDSATESTENIPVVDSLSPSLKTEEVILNNNVSTTNKTAPAKEITLPETSIPAPPPVASSPERKDTKEEPMPLIANTNEDKGNTGAPINIQEEKTKTKEEETLAKLKQEEDAKNLALSGRRPGIATAKKRPNVADYDKKEAAMAYAPSLERNIFRGRVTDSLNNGLPYASITNPEENVGTYADVNGYFNLSSTDTVLNVQVRSIGFDEYKYQLSNSRALNNIMLQEDRSFPVQVIEFRQVNTQRRSNRMEVTVTEPEPVDGWYNYDIYIANNLNEPNDFRQKRQNKGEVEISFEVDSYGEPTNLRIEKSLCESCDREAIRLIKNGPRFKSNKAGNRTTITIPFGANP